MLYLLADNPDNNVGSIAGGLVTALFVLSVIIITVVTILYLFMKQRRKHKRMERLQRDILSRYKFFILYIYIHDIFLLRVEIDSSVSEMSTSTFVNTEKLNPYSQFLYIFLVVYIYDIL